VSSTILMVIVLVVMWLVVLVPMFVRRHDEINEERSVDRFATAMRVLSRRSHPAAGPAAARSSHRSAPPAYRLGSPTAMQVRAEAHRRMIARRRRTLSLLVLLTASGLVGAFTLTARLWAVAGPALLLLAGYLVWLRQEVRRQHARWQRRAAVFSRSAPSHRPHTVRPARPPAAGRRGGLVDGYRSGRRSAPADPAAPAAGSDADRTWQPSPVPPPTYATKPAAHRPPPATAVELDDDDPTFAEIDEVVPSVDQPRVVNG
jgi:hypothetical protein